MASWTLEHIPAGGGDPVVASLATWGFAGVQIQFVNWSTDQASITARGGSIAFDAAQFGYKDKIVIWRDGVRFFQGWIVGLGLTAQAQESRTYTLAGPSWWLEHLPFTWPTWPAKEELSLGERASFRWLQFAMNSAIAKGAPIAKAADNYAPFILPTPDLRASSNCLEVIQRVARLHPMSAGFWDYSAEVPVFCASLRAALTAQTVTIGDDVETLGFTPLPDQQVESVHIAYNYTDSYGAHTVHNTAGTEPYGYGPNKLHIAVDVETSALASEAQSAGIAPLLYASLSPLAWSGAVNMHEGDTPLPVIRPGSALSVAGGRAEWESMNTVVQSVAWAVSPETNDLCTISIGAPEHLGPQDYLEFARAGTLAASSAANNPSPWEPPTPPTLDPGDPGTLDDLNGGTAPAAPDGSLLTQAKGVSARVSGCAPLDGVETYRRWRTQIASGTLRRWYWLGNEVCAADPTADEAWALSGTCQWTASDDVTVDNGMQYIDEASVTHAMAHGVVMLPGEEPIMGSLGTLTVTPQLRSYVASDACYTGHNTPADSWRATGANALSLDNEDTEYTAYLRAIIEQSAEWSSSLSSAIYTARIALNFERRAMRYGHGQMVRIGGTDEDPIMELQPAGGYTPWGTYQLTVVLRRRPVDSGGAPTGDGSYSDWETRTHLLTANIDGEAMVAWQEVDAPRGYEVIVGSHTIDPFV